MAYKTKYQLMDSSIVTDENGNNYPDLATFPLSYLRLSAKPSTYKLTQNNLYRFFDLTHEYYNDFNFYDYITLWLNDITDISNEENFQKEIKFFGKNDLDSWYQEYLREE